jgi:hypothetical protein
MICRGPDFLAIWLLAHPLPPYRITEKERDVADGGGVRGLDVKPKHTTARKAGPL